MLHFVLGSSDFSAYTDGQFSHNITISFLFAQFAVNRKLERWIVEKIQYDTIRYETVDWGALKSWRDGQLNLVHGPETKNTGKNE